MGLEYFCAKAKFIYKIYIDVDQAITSTALYNSIYYFMLIIYSVCDSTYE